MGSTSTQEVHDGILDRYRQRTPNSRRLYEQAQGVMPGGDSRLASYFGPYPTFLREGKGCYVTDHDGNRYIDILNNYTSLVHGHAPDRVVKAANEQFEKGSALCQQSGVQQELAEQICKRFAGIEKIRFTNSATEAVMQTMKAARAITGRDIVMKMAGGYHGSSDHCWVSIASPDPEPLLDYGRGVPASVLRDTRVAEFNNLETVEAIFRAEGEQIAAIITEPMMGSGGCIPPEPDFLSGLRRIADEHGALLIFDETMTSRLAYGGLQGVTGVVPDLTAMGKWLGGGVPFGVFGGTEDAMKVFDPRDPVVPHSGTFCGNDLACACGLAAVELFDEAAVDRLNGLGDLLGSKVERVFEDKGIGGVVTGIGSVRQLHWGPGEVRSFRDAMGRYERYEGLEELQDMYHLELLNRGVYSCHRGMLVPSTPMTEAEVDEVARAIDGTLELLRPCLEEKWPTLLLS